MDENSSSDNTSPSYYVYQQQQQPGKRSSRSSHHHHSRAAPAYNSSGISGPPPAAPFGYGQPMTSRHGGQMPYPPSQQDMGGSYYDGGAMPFVGADSAAAMSAGIPAAASQIFQSGGSNYQYDSSNVCGGPNDMPAYGSAAAISQSAAMSSDMYGARRRGKFRRQAIRLPDAPPLKQQCRRRLPTPEPDILERVYIRRIPCKIIEEIIEEPMTPPPRVVEKFINQPPKQNRYVRRIVKVPPRSGFGMYGAGGSTMTGGYGAYGAGYTPGHGIGGVGGSSYGYMDKGYNMGEGTSSTYDGASYASMQQQQPAPSMDYEAARGIPGYGMQVGSNVMHSSFANMPSASLSGASAGYQGGGGMGSSFSSGGNYDCYPISGGGGGQFQSQNYYGGAAATEAPPPPIMMPPATAGPSGGMMPNYYQPSQRYFPPQSSQPPTGISNLGYYSGAPPNLICSLRGSGTPGCPFNLCCYPASAPPMPFSAGGPSVGSGGYPTTTGGGSQALGGAFDYAPMPIPSGPVYGGNAPQFDYGSSRAPAYMPSSTANVQFPPANFGQSIGGRFDGNLPGGATGLTAYPTYGGGNLNMYSGGGSAGFGGSSVDYGSGMGMYGGSSGMFGGQPHSSGSSSFGNFSGYAGSSQPSFQDFSQYGGGSYGGGGTMMGGVNPAAYGCPPNECGGRVFRQIIAMPEPPAEPIFCRQRLPTPPPDIYERILVCRPPRKVMYNIVEQPTCPPPIVRNQYVMANPQPPSVMNQCVQVPPKSYQSQAINMGSSGLGAYGGQCYGGGMMSNSVCMPMGSNCCGMMPMGGSGCMSCTCMPCQVFGLGDDYYSGGYPGYDYGGGYPGIGGGGYPGIGGGYPGIGGGYPGIGGGYPGIGGGYPGIGGGYPGIGGGYPGIGGGYPGFGGGYPGFGGGGYPGYGGGGYPGMVGYPGTGGYPGYDGGYGGLGGYGGGYGGYGGGGGY